jgi:hypothetical protein
MAKQADGEPSELPPPDSDPVVDIPSQTAEVEPDGQPPDQMDEAAPGAEDGPAAAQQQQEDGDKAPQEQQHDGAEEAPQEQQEEEAEQQPKEPKEFTGFIGMMGMFYYRSGKDIPQEIEGEPVEVDPPGMMGLFNWHRENQGVSDVLAEFR